MAQNCLWGSQIAVKKKIKLFLMKNFYDIVFSTRNIGGNKKMFPPFQVCVNDAVMEQFLLPNFGACITNTLIFLLEGKGPKITASILLCYAKI